jgi:hypothetical protein
MRAFSCGISLFVLLAAGQFASAQRRLTPLPHPMGYPPHAPALAIRSASSPWTPLRRQPTFLANGGGNPILLMDGSVLVQDAGSRDWWKLTADQNGSYINGTWKQIASMVGGYSPFYHSSAVLPDGRLIVEGGEYICTPGCNAVWSNLGAIYDPVANTWKAVRHPDGWSSIGDAQSVVLANGTYMQANCCSKQAALLNPTTLTWTATGKGKFDPNDEEGWVLLPNGKVLAVDAYVPIPPFPFIPNGMNFELYDPSSGTWNVAGNTAVQLWDSWLNCGEAHPTSELGPGVLRPDGTVFWAGANSCPGASGATAIYDSNTNQWKAGPYFPNGNDIADGPAALEPNGKVLMMASPGFGNAPATFFEWDGRNLNAVPGTPNAPSETSYFGNMLVLPTGQILLTDYSDDIEIYTPSGTPALGTVPILIAGPEWVKAGTTYRAFGFRFNGVSQGAFYGDDAQAASNFPLVRITNVQTGHVRYSRAHHPSTMGVASYEMNSVRFDVPANQEKGLSKLQIVANGVASSAMFITVK